MQSRVTYFLAHYQKGEKIHKELRMNLLSTGEEDILVGMVRMRISFSLKLFWREAKNGASLHHKMLDNFSLINYKEQKVEK
jgi:hypothetical protein